MPNKERYWSKAYLIGALILAAYGIGTSFWCSAQGDAYRKREVARDKRFHATEHEFEEYKAGLRARGLKDLKSDPEFANRYAAATKVADDLNRESHDDFNGKKALVWSGLGGVVLMGSYFFVAAGRWRRMVRAAEISGQSAPPRTDASAA